MKTQEVIGILLQENIHKNNVLEVNARFSISSHRRYIGDIVVLVKKFIRKLIIWYIEPLVIRQNEINNRILNICNENNNRNNIVMLNKVELDIKLLNKRLDEILKSYTNKG